jgi:aquaporin Z
MLMVMIFADSHNSGAHYNPAVTLAVFIRGRCEKKDVAPYMGPQVRGGRGRVSGHYLHSWHGHASGD